MKRLFIIFPLLVIFLIMASGVGAGVVKWSQPPDMKYGVNIRSTEPRPIVADDWQCKDPRPVTDLHFWGSYIGWKRDVNPLMPPVVSPGVRGFVIRIYKDVPADDPTNPVSYSHPGDLLYEVTVYNFIEQYVATIPHPFPTHIEYEHKFYYSMDLPVPFNQEEGTIYWISIAAIQEDINAFPWGWETSSQHWNDNACLNKELAWIMLTPSMLPPFYGEHYRTVDMAFELTVPYEPPPPPEPVKWQQRPDMKEGINIPSIADRTTSVSARIPYFTVADDWLCLDGSPVSDLHFWGSYPGWMEDSPVLPDVLPPGVDAFKIQVYSDAPIVSVEGFSRPDKLLYEVWVKDFTETYVATIPLPWGKYEHKFRYDLDLPRLFWQRRNRIYWLNISALPRPYSGPGNKWIQKPDMYCGVNIRSTETVQTGTADWTLIADDWKCEDPRPVMDVHFWGSYIGWERDRKTPNVPLPDAIDVDYFVIRFYSDVPADPTGTYPWSHPGDLLYEVRIPRTDFTEQYVDAILLQDGTYEHKFKYSLLLPKPFYQKLGEIYWISIAAHYDNLPVMYPWGWETCDPADHWNDNACRFWSHNNYWAEIQPSELPYWCYDIPYVDMAFELTVGSFPWGWESSMDRWNDFAVQGWYKNPNHWLWEMITHPYLARHIDMSFELTTCKGPIKWLQFPDMADGINIVSLTPPPNKVVADDWLCTNGKPVTEVHFWGSYLTCDGSVHWEQDNPGPPNTQLPTTPFLQGFKLSFHEDIPAGSDPKMPWSHPGALLKEVRVEGPNEFMERYWDSVPHINEAGNIWWEHKFYYIVPLRNEDIFPQKQGTVYWLDIAAIQPMVSEWCWGWETSKDHWNDNAVKGDGTFWKDLAPGTLIDFEDLTLGQVYNVGDTFTTSGTTISVKPFQGTLGGFAKVENGGLAGGSGNEMNVNNVNLEFYFNCTLYGLSLMFGEYGGSLNIEINNDFRQFNDFQDINGLTIGGVYVTVVNGAGIAKGSLELAGKIDQFALGGQELYIDDVKFNCKPIDMAFLLITEDDTKYCEGDFDRDGDVDGADLARFAADFGRTDCHNNGDCEGDFDYDGDVDGADLAKFAIDFGRTDCPCALNFIGSY